MKTQLSILALALLGFSVSAQTVTVEFNDTTESNHARVIVSSRPGQVMYDSPFYKMKPDSKGVAKLDSVKIEGMTFAPAWLTIGQDEYPFIFDTENPITISVRHSKNGKPEVKFKGKNAKESDYFREYQRLMDFFVYYSTDVLNDTIPYERKEAMLEKNVADLAKKIKKVPDGKIKDFLRQLSDDAYLNYQIRFCSSKDKAKRDELYSKIDVNSSISLYNYLPMWAFERTLSKPDYKVDTTPWGLEYLKAIREKITDKYVRDYLLEQCALKTLNWGTVPDPDAFWIPFTEFAGTDNRAYKMFNDKVQSMKSTKSGMKALDFSFQDADGKSHRLSDLFGKVLYIDIWASWCGPCRKEIPHIDRHFKEYYKGNDKVRFVSISVDDTPSPWLAIINKDKPEWEQYLAAGKDNEEMSKAYGINAIPRFMIINADGSINNADAFRPSDPDFRAKLDEIISSQK